MTAAVICDNSRKGGSNRTAMETVSAMVAAKAMVAATGDGKGDE